MFTLAFLTDPHIAPLPKPQPRELIGKRILGYLNWQVSRKAFHIRDILDRVTANMLAQNPDHIAVGGDLVNLSLQEEFGRALDWLQTLGSPEQVSVIPGNHDAYVRMNRATSLGLWEAYMTSDFGLPKPLAPASNGFPWVRRFGNIALVGLSTAVPTPPFFASGRLGEDQLAALSRILKILRSDGFFRIVMVHHPPLIGMTGPRRGLRDAHELQPVIERDGAELVLFGHRHFHSLTELPVKEGTTIVLGGPSASAAHGAPEELARYYLISIDKSRDKWQCEIAGWGLKLPDGPVEEIARKTFTL